MQKSNIPIHVDEKLDESAQIELEEQLRNVQGVFAPRFSLEKDYLLFVSYNSEVVKASALIDKARENGFKAQLIGL